VVNEATSSWTADHASSVLPRPASRMTTGAPLPAQSITRWRPPPMSIGPDRSVPDADGADEMGGKPGPHEAATRAIAAVRAARLRGALTTAPWFADPC